MTADLVEPRYVQPGVITKPLLTGDVKHKLLIQTIQTIETRTKWVKCLPGAYNNATMMVWGSNLLQSKSTLLIRYLNVQL